MTTHHAAARVRSSLRPALRLAASSAVLLALCAACTFSDGERAATGECPAGETCSTDTPSGLGFYGSFLADSASLTTAIHPIALGGSQNISWTNPEGAVRDVAVASDAPWLVTVDATDEERDANALWRGDNARHLEGLAVGQAHVRVSNAESGELYDRAVVTVARTARVDGLVLGADDTAGELVAGETATVVFRLFDGADERLVDEGLTVSSDVELEQLMWDEVELTVPTDVESVSFTVSAGHRRWDVTLPVR